MFLQGTASVYSKKVEFLWQAVLKMLDLLTSKKALDEVEGTCKYYLLTSVQYSRDPNTRHSVGELFEYWTSQHSLIQCYLPVE